MSSHPGMTVPVVPVVPFLVLAYALTWSVWCAAAAVDGHAGVVWLGAWGPAAAALILTHRYGGRRSVTALLDRLRPRGLTVGVAAAALLLPFAVAVAGVVVDAARTGRGVGLRSALPLYLLPAHLVLGVVIGPLQEEVGWRGVALPSLLCAYSRLTASLVLGVVWATWHLPLFALERRELPLTAFLIGAVASSVMYTELHERSGRSLAVMIAFHAAWNTALIALLQRPAGEGRDGPFIAATAVSVVIASTIAASWATAPRRRRAAVPEDGLAPPDVADDEPPAQVARGR